MPGNSDRFYWKSLEERDRDPDWMLSGDDEFPEAPAPAPGLHRRDFLKAAGFSAAGALLAGCSRAPLEKAIPYLVQPEEVVPGRAYYYASTCAGCTAACGLLVKNRDGRPIKLEGNREHPLSRGGLCAVGQASILGLYDSLRLKHPVREGNKIDWPELDREIVARLESVRRDGGAVRFLTGSITSPTMRVSLGRFLKQFPDARHVVYDPLSSSAILDAHLQTHGARVLPRYRFDRAEVIVSFDADFLGTWISPVEFTSGYRSRRAIETGEPAGPIRAGRPDATSGPSMSYHVQFEARLSLTGSKADKRVRIAPGEPGLVLTHLAARVASLAGASFPPGGLDPAPVPASFLDALAKRLWQSRGRSLVVSGSQDAATQVLCNFVNHLLGNYGATLDVERPSYQRQGNDAELAALLDELRQAKVAALFIAGVNPVYDLPGGETIAAALKRTPLVVSFADRINETAASAHYVCPDHHPLESWSDAEPVNGVLSLTQPAIHPLAGTRPMLESLAAWTPEAGPKTAYDILRAHWEAEVFPRQSREPSFQAFWQRAVHDGYAEVEREAVAAKPFNLAAVRVIEKADRPAGQGHTLVLYPKAGMLDGRHAHNPWLQELPDPISKVAWDNYACLSPAAAERLGVVEGDVVRLTPGGTNRAFPAVQLPVFIQPGQHDGIIAVALGYGAKASERFSRVGRYWLFGRTSAGENGLVGKSVAPFLTLTGGALQYTARVAIAKAGRRYELASTQVHHSVMVPKRLALGNARPRPIIQETSLAELAGPPAPEAHPHGGQHEDLWPDDHPYTGHRWGMVIDLHACTGCSACVVACQAENNVPVVGRDEMRRRRQIHWIRVDRYYSESRPEAGADTAAGSGNVEVAFQPMFCQQCDNAPCETVCPVLATVHSAEGLNQQIYNRCVGTRYCSNNCPYKSRRFNWFDYSHDDRLANLVLNPDVTVRSRGVMEKCTFCVQRIQEVKIEARRRGEPLADGAIQPACQQSCPAQAIVFGDLNDPGSRVARLMKDRRRYKVLEELNVRPAVGYLKVVRNREQGPGRVHHG